MPPKAPRPLRSYCCVRCAYTFEGPPVGRQPGECPACESVYFVWVNYEAWLAQGGPPKKVDRNDLG